MVATALDVGPTTPTTPTKPKPIPTLSGGRLFTGHIKEMAQAPLALVTRVREELGDVGAVDVFWKKIIVVSDPEAVERILVENVRNYTKQTRGYAQLRRVFGNGLVTSEGSFWLRQRRIAQPAFHREKLGKLSQAMVRDTADTLAAMASKTGTAFDFSYDMMKLTMRIIGEVLFSVDVSGDSDVAGQAINELVHQLMRRTVSLNAPAFVPTAMNRRFAKAKDDVEDLVMRVIRARRDGKSEGDDLMSMLLDMVDEETGERMTDEQLKDEVITLFSAGHETTSMAVSWTLHALLDHPAILERLLAEIDAGPLTVERLMRMPYLDAVLKESFRLYPPIWMVARYAEADDVLAGHRVKKGQMLFVSQWAVHRSPKLWHEPLKFDPSRFLVEDPSRAKYAYFPFLGGPRKCIGDQLAILEAKIILATLLSKLTFTREPGHPVVPDPAISLRFKHGLWVNAAPRATATTAPSDEVPTVPEHDHVVASPSPSLTPPSSSSSSSQHAAGKCPFH